MSLVIVTDRCFLLCEKVTSITIREYEVERKSERSLLKTMSKKSKKGTSVKTKIPIKYTLCISYVPSGNYNQPSSGFGKSTSNGEEHSIELDIFGKKETFALYKKVVEEIREQTPDAAYLDKLVNKLLVGQIGEPEEFEKDEKW